MKFPSVDIKDGLAETMQDYMRKCTNALLGDFEKKRRELIYNKINNIPQEDFKIDVGIVWTHYYNKDKIVFSIKTDPEFFYQENKFIIQTHYIDYE